MGYDRSNAKHASALAGGCSKASSAARKMAHSIPVQARARAKVRLHDALAMSEFRDRRPLVKVLTDGKREEHAGRTRNETKRNETFPQTVLPKAERGCRPGKSGTKRSLSRSSVSGCSCGGSRLRRHRGPSDVLDDASVSTRPVRTIEGEPVAQPAPAIPRAAQTTDRINSVHPSISAPRNTHLLSLVYDFFRGGDHVPSFFCRRLQSLQKQTTAKAPCFRDQGSKDKVTILSLVQINSRSTRGGYLGPACFGTSRLPTDNITRTRREREGTSRQDGGSFAR